MISLLPFMKTLTCECFLVVLTDYIIVPHLFSVCLNPNHGALPLRIIGTPGRLMHVIKEMNLKLQNVEYVVFDEADR